MADAHVNAYKQDVRDAVKGATEAVAEITKAYDRLVFKLEADADGPHDELSVGQLTTDNAGFNPNKPVAGVEEPKDEIKADKLDKKAAVEQEVSEVPAEEVVTPKAEQSESEDKVSEEAKKEDKKPEK